MLEWFYEVERFFDIIDILDRNKVKVVTIQFQSAVTIWWEQTQAVRARELKRPMRTWKKLKKLMRTRFLPQNFQRVLFTKYRNCKQGLRTVEDYTLEFHRLASRNILKETEEQLIARYAGDLKWSVQEKI